MCGAVARKRRKARRALAEGTASNAAIHQSNGTAVPAKAASTESKERGSIAASTWKLWQVCWAVFGPLMTLAAFCLSIKPSVSIEPGVNIDPTQSYSTQVTITNRGYFSIHNLTFGCGIGGGGATIIH